MSVSRRAGRAPQAGQRVGGSSSASRPHAGQTRRTQQAGSPPSAPGARLGHRQRPTPASATSAQPASSRPRAHSSRLGHWLACPMSDDPPYRPHRRRARLPVELGGPRRLGAADRARRAPPPAAPGRRRLAALRPTASSTTRCRRPALPPANARRRAAAAVARGAARRPARRPDPAGRARSSRTTPPSSPSPGSGTPARCSRSTAHRVLVDPVWGDRVSPSPLVGPDPAAPGAGRRSRTLPQVDAVLISHDHYDHLDLPTVRALLRDADARRSSSRWASASTCARGACPTTRIVELDWDGATTVGELTLTCTEARHFSGRFLARDTTLWASWVITGPRHRVFFGGDTGYTPAFAGIGARLGPFDLTLLPIGAYNDAWQAIHMDPEEAVRAHGDLGGRVLLPDPLGHVQPGVPPLGRAGRSGCCAAAERSGTHGRRPAPGRADRRPGAAGARRLVDGGRLGGRPAGRRGPAGRRRSARRPARPSGVTRTASCGSPPALDGVDRHVEHGGDAGSRRRTRCRRCPGTALATSAGVERLVGEQPHREHHRRRASTPSRRTAGAAGRTGSRPPGAGGAGTWSAKKTPSHGPIQ